MNNQDRLDAMKSYINRMEHYGSMSGATAEIILAFIGQQQEEIERLQTIEQAYEALKKSL